MFYYKLKKFNRFNILIFSITNKMKSIKITIIILFKFCIIHKDLMKPIKNQKVLKNLDNNQQFLIKQKGKYNFNYKNMKKL